MNTNNFKQMVRRTLVPAALAGAAFAGTLGVTSIASADERVVVQGPKVVLEAPRFVLEQVLPPPPPPAPAAEVVVQRPVVQEVVVPRPRVEVIERPRVEEVIRPRPVVEVLGRPVVEEVRRPGIIVERGPGFGPVFQGGRPVPGFAPPPRGCDRR